VSGLLPLQGEERDCRKYVYDNFFFQSAGGSDADKRIDVGRGLPGETIRCPKSFSQGRIGVLKSEKKNVASGVGGEIRTEISYPCKGGQ